MAVPATSVLAASSATGLLLIVIAVVGFAVVAVVAAMVLALLQAVLPGGDTEADRIHAAELEREHEESEPAPH
jgi:hypothetical protein